MAEPLPELHVWRVPLATVEGPARGLSEDELRRAARFVFDRDRVRFASTRAVLRALLGRYLERDPAELAFAYGVHGKPELAAEPPDGLRFSVSHSGDLALIAVAFGRDVGVDVERLERRVEYRDLASAWFAPEEARTVSELPEAEGREAFIRLWTFKEAYLKATGAGIGGGLARPRVRLASGAVVVDDESVEGAWCWRELRPAPGYVAAACVRGAVVRLRCGVWPHAQPDDTWSDCS